MSPIPSFVTNAVERLLFKSVVVSEVCNIGPRFRLMRLEGKGFEGVKWVPGQTAQFHLGNLMTRAYTPIDLDTKKWICSVPLLPTWWRAWFNMGVVVEDRRWMSRHAAEGFSRLR